MHPAPTAKNYQTKLRTMLLASGYALVLGLTANQARAIAPIGDDSAIFITADVSYSESSNIFLASSNSKSSGLADFVPGASYEWGKNNSLDSGYVKAYEDFQVYSNFSSGNNQLFNFEFSNKFEDPTTKIMFDASMHQYDQPEVGIQNVGFLVDRNVYHIDGTDEQKIDASSSLAGGIIFDDTDYRAPGYADLKSTTVPVNYYVAVDPKLDFSAGARVRFNTLEGGNDSTDVYVDVGMRGEFTPMLTGEFDVGYNHQSIEEGNGTTGLGADAALVWAATPDVSVKLGFQDDFSYAPDGSPIRLIAPSLGVIGTIDQQWSVDASGSYGRYSYLTLSRADDFYTLQGGVTYTYSLNLKLRAGYTLLQDNSNVSVDNFTDNIFTISASLRF